MNERYVAGVEKLQKKTNTLGESEVPDGIVRSFCQTTYEQVEFRGVTTESINKLF